MLVLKRKIGDSIYIECPNGQLIKLTVLETKNNNAARIHIKKRDVQSSSSSPLSDYEMSSSSSSANDT